MIKGKQKKVKECFWKRYDVIVTRIKLTANTIIAVGGAIGVVLGLIFYLVTKIKGL